MLCYLKVAGTHWANLTNSDSIVLFGKRIKAIWTSEVIQNSSNSLQNLLGQLRICSAKYGRAAFEVKSTDYLHSLCQYVTVGKSSADKLICATESLKTECKFDILMWLKKTKEQFNRQCQGTLWSGADSHSVADDWYPGGLAARLKTQTSLSGSPKPCLHCPVSSLLRVPQRFQWGQKIPDLSCSGVTWEISTMPVLGSQYCSSVHDVQPLLLAAWQSF